jgi:Amt family ammonium transporter
MGGKMLGIAFLLGGMTLISNLIGSSVYADATPVLKGNDIVNPINTVWTLVAAYLVFGMQVGFTMLEAGFCRSRETVNVLMECVVDTCLCGLLFYAWGFAFMFGAGTPIIGTQYFFLQGIPDTYGTTGVAFLAFWIFRWRRSEVSSCGLVGMGSTLEVRCRRWTSPVSDGYPRTRRSLLAQPASLLCSSPTRRPRPGT